MICLSVETVTGHYGLPGQVGVMGVKSSWPTCPPPTMRGFLESLGGEPYLSYVGRFAYGRVRKPFGKGNLLRSAHVWGSKPMTKEETKAAKERKAAKEKAEAEGKIFRRERKKDKVIGTEIRRPYHVETYVEPSYVVLVEGPWENKIRKALRGEIKRYGVLYLGESEDLVHWVSELPEPPENVEWLVPGNEMALPVLPGRGYDNLHLTLGNFKFAQGEPHWMEGK